jgi:hypothetical protein
LLIQKSKKRSKPKKKPTMVDADNKEDGEMDCRMKLKKSSHKKSKGVDNSSPKKSKSKKDDEKDMKKSKSKDNSGHHSSHSKKSDNEMNQSHSQLEEIPVSSIDDTTRRKEIEESALDVVPDDSISCPTRKVIEQAMATGPDTGWRDGWLTFNKGLCEPDHGSSRIALWRTNGRSWATMAEQMPSLIEGLLVRLRLLKLPLISSEESSIPKEALIAAEIALSTLAHAFRFEWQNANPKSPWKLELLPESILKPWTHACDRLGMPGVGLGINAFFLGRYQFKDNAVWSENEPYAERIENITFNPAVFGSREERVFMGCFVETCAIVSVGIHAFVDAQEAVMLDNPKLLRGALREMKRTADRMVTAFNKISTMKVSGSNNYCDPIIWVRCVKTLFQKLSGLAC